MQTDSDNLGTTLQRQVMFQETAANSAPWSPHLQMILASRSLCMVDGPFWEEN